MTDDDVRSLPVERISLHHAVEMLRGDVPVRDEWRDRLLHEVSTTPPPERTLSPDFLPDVPARVPVFRRTLSVQPFVAIAACLLAMIVGAAGAMAIVHASIPVSTGVGLADDAAIPVQRALTNGTDTRQIIRFVLVAPGAAKVSIVGDFNSWDPKATPLKTARDGSTWLIDMPLTTGRHVYAFMVDGDIVADPSAPRVVDRDFGVQNSVILVGSL